MILKYKKVFALLIVTFGLISGLVVFTQTPTYAAAPIPDGCPGSTKPSNGPPAVCATIPAGCPGSTQQASNPAQADRPEAGCPYQATGTQSNELECGNDAVCADCSSKDQSGCIDCSDNKCSDPATKCTVESCDLVNNLINPAIYLFSGLVGLAVALSIIIGAIQYSSSAGDPQKAAKGRDRIKNAIIALIAYIFLFAFLRFIIPGGLF